MKISKLFCIFVAATAITFALTSCGSEYDLATSNVVVNNVTAPLMKEAVNPAAPSDEYAVMFEGQGSSVNYLGMYGTNEQKLVALGITSKSYYSVHVTRDGTKIGFSEWEGPKSTALLLTSGVEIEDDVLYLDAEKVNFDNFILKLANTSEIDLMSIPFVIEEDINVYDKSGNVYAVIYAGVYPFHEGIGDWGGGYKISSVCKALENLVSLALAGDIEYVNQYLSQRIPEIEEEGELNPEGIQIAQQEYFDRYIFQKQNENGLIYTVYTGIGDIDYYEIRKDDRFNRSQKEFLIIFFSTLGMDDVFSGNLPIDFELTTTLKDGPCLEAYKAELQTILAEGTMLIIKVWVTYTVCVYGGGSTCAEAVMASYELYQYNQTYRQRIATAHAKYLNCLKN